MSEELIAELRARIAMLERSLIDQSLAFSRKQIQTKQRRTIKLGDAGYKEKERERQRERYLRIKADPIAYAERIRKAAANARRCRDYPETVRRRKPIVPSDVPTSHDPAVPNTAYNI